jgi:hypothetical protein
VDRDCAKEPTGHGSPLPSLVHGGPGRAGGGEELGELRSVFHCMQRTALQCSPGRLVSFTGNWIKGAQAPIAEEHLFKRDYDQLAIGDTIETKADQLLNSPPPVGPTSPLHRYRHRQRRWRPARKPRYRAPFLRSRHRASAEGWVQKKRLLRPRNSLRYNSLGPNTTSASP